ncbi:hypothetical protein Tco_0085463 [Tanacetum coccineum]
MVDGTLMTVHMFVEKKYPLTKETLQKMLNWKLEAEAEREDRWDSEASTAVLKSDASFNEAEIIALKTYIEKLKKDKKDNLIKINNDDNDTKSLDKVIGSQLVDNNKKGLGYNVVPPPPTGLFAPPTIDLSHSGIEKFKEPEFVGYGVKVDKIVSENSSVEIKKTPDAPIIEDWVSDDEEQDESKPKSEKKTVIPTVKKIEFVKAKQDDKTVRNTVKYAEMYRSQRPRGNQRNWNNQKSQQLGSDFVMIKKACYVCGSFDHLQYTCKQKRQLNGQREEKPVWNNARRVNHQNSLRITQPNPKRHMVPRKILTRSGPISLNTARQSYLNVVCCCCSRQVNTARPKAVVNAVRTNRVNAVKASACWVWRPVKPNSASITLKRYDYVDARGRSRLGYKAAVKLHDQFDDEKRAGAELTQQNDKSQYKKRNYQEESFTHKEDMAPMAFSDSECEKVKQEKDGIEFKIKNFDKASKDLDQLLGNLISLLGPYYGLDEFKGPEFKGYGPKNKQVSQDKSSFVESSPNVDKETVFPVNKKLMLLKHQHVRFWRLSNLICRIITLKRYDYVACKRKIQGNPETELEDLVRLNNPEEKKKAGAKLTQQNDKSQYKKVTTAGYRVTTAGSRLLLLVRKSILLKEVTTAS